MRRLGEHDTATCPRMISRREFGDRHEAEAWITRTGGTNYIHQIRPVGTSSPAGRYEVKFCARDEPAPPVRRWR